MTQDRPDRDGERSGPGDGPGRGPQRGWSEPTPEEWEQALAFLRENSPHRLKIYERFEQEWRQQHDSTTEPAQLPRSLRGARARFAARVQLLKMLEERDPPLFEVAIEQFRLEDQIIGHLHAARESRGAGNEAAADEAIASAMVAVRAYAAGSLKERESRIERMRQDLSREEQRLEQDRANFDTLVERLLERFQRSLPGTEREGPSDGGREGSREGGREGGPRHGQGETAPSDGAAGS